MTAALLQNGEQQFFDLNGEPLASGLVYMYVPGTTTPSTTWVDQAQTTPNTDPIILDPLGRAIIWGVGTYRQLVTDYLGNLVYDQLTSDGGLSGLQAQITALSNQVTSLNSQVTSLSGQVSAQGATGLKFDVINTSGSYVIKASSLYVLVVADGGGGAGTNNTPSIGVAGGGSGGSAYQNLTNLQVGNTLTISVGQGGPGGGISASSGGPGAGSSVSSGTQSIATISASGGGAGIYPTTGGGGGIGSGGVINVQGFGGSVGLGGFGGVFSPYGDGGSIAQNTLIVNGAEIVNQNGAPGIVFIMGVW